MADGRGRHLANVADLWNGPLRDCPSHGREQRERVELAERGEPPSDAAPAHPPPAFEREEHVEIPERERLQGKVENRRPAPQLGEAEDAVELAHAPGAGCPSADSRSRSRLQPRGAGRRRDRVLEDGGVAAERILPAAGEIERLLHALRGGKRQDDPDDERNRPEGNRDDARGMQPR